MGGKGYRPTRDQTNVPKGRVRYAFDTHVLGRRFRKNLTCMPRHVEGIYGRWLAECLKAPESRIMFFESYESFINYIRKTRGHLSLDQVYRHEYAYSLVREYFKRDLPLKDIRRGHIEDFLAWRMHTNKRTQGTVSQVTVNRTCAELSVFFTWAIRREMYDRMNPCFGLKPPEHNEREVEVTQDNIAELFTAARKVGKLYTAVLLGLLAGLRRNEVFCLKWADVDIDRSIIRLRSEITKGKKRRAVAIPEFLRTHLVECRLREPFAESVLNWSENPFRYEWNRMRDSLSFRVAGGTPLRFHDLRHIYAQTLRDYGVPLSDIQSLLGHSTTAVTEKRYAMFGGRVGIHDKVALLKALVDPPCQVEDKGQVAG